jgi:hypothetical protein
VHTYLFACGSHVTLRDLAVALACGQRDFLVNVGTPAARHLRRLHGVRVILDSAAWPPGNPRRPRFDAWWQHLRRWRDGPDSYGNLRYAIAYDTIGDAALSARTYGRTMGRMQDRAVRDLPVVPVLHFPNNPRTIGLDLLQSWAGQRDDLLNGGGSVDRPVYALGGLVPHHGSQAAIAWVQGVAAELAHLIDDVGIDPALLGIHILGSARSVYCTPFQALGVPLWCDTSTPAQQAGFGAKALAWAYDDRYGLPRTLLERSRSARLAFWLCRERERLGLPWTTPDHLWLEAPSESMPLALPRQQYLFSEGII